MATIIFDFDDTLFDTKSLKEKIFNKLIENGVPFDVVHQSYKDSQKVLGIYSPNNHIKVLKDIHNIDINENLNDWIMSLDLETYIFPEVNNLLNNLHTKHNLILLTLGDKDFQSLKINQSQISHYFKEIHIIDYSKELFLKKIDSNHETYFINDKDEENNTIEKSFPNLNIIKKMHGKSIRLPMHLTDI